LASGEDEKMVRLAIALVVLFLIVIFFEIGGVAGLVWASVAILVSFLVARAIAFRGGTYYGRWARRPNPLSAILAGATWHARNLASALAAWVTPQPDREDQSLGRAARRYIKFLVVATIVVLAITVVLLLGFVHPGLNTVRKTLHESREEFRETVRHNP
jgi:hypothetical protein